MLEIRAMMNSSVEAVLNFKTCCGARAFDQNLEIHVHNHGHRPVTVPSRFDLHGDYGTYRVETLMPHGNQVIPPGTTIAFYCSMDEQRWQASRRLVFYDEQGNDYPVDIRHGQEESR